MAPSTWNCKICDGHTKAERGTISPCSPISLTKTLVLTITKLIIMHCCSRASTSYRSGSSRLYVGSIRKSYTLTLSVVIIPTSQQMLVAVRAAIFRLQWKHYQRGHRSAYESRAVSPLPLFPPWK